MAGADVMAGLNREQRRAVECVHGPVVVLAGAGSGKTTTITRRIAHQVLSGAFAQTEILAVSFTKKAARAMKERLAALGVPGVVASTFHSAAQCQLLYFTDERRPVVANKLSLIYPLLRALPEPYRNVNAGDLAAEIERARNNRLRAENYLASLAGRSLPLPAELMAEMFRGYEQAKRERGVIDHEDQLELAIGIFDSDEAAALEFRGRYRTFTVDEFQDVSLLQWTLLARWLGGRDELCAVGDDYQSIYGFAGATPSYLLSLTSRFPGATVVALEQNYRSTREVLSFANRLTPHLGGRKKSLRAEREGPRPTVAVFDGYEQEADAIASRCAELQRDGIALSQLAILYRVNYRSASFEEALLARALPFVVHSGAFLERSAARQLLPRLRRLVSARDVAGSVAAEAAAAGLLAGADRGLGAGEVARQADLARFVALGSSYAGDDATVGGFLAELERRFGGDRNRDAVQLLTYHSSKGLEWEAVFLPRLEERELPYWRAIQEGSEDEERRLLYVGMTRARRHLWLSSTKEGHRSRFLDEIDPPAELLQSPRGAGAPAGRAARASDAQGSSRRAASRRSSAPTSKRNVNEGWLPEWMRKRPSGG